LRELEAILTHPKVRALIDFSQPVALLRGKAAVS
jgi:hypothetical protein